MRKLVVFGNWKMNTTAREGVELATTVAKETAGVGVEVGVCPPFVYVPRIAEAVRGTHVAVGAQNVYFEEKGAFTGEVSCGMLKDAGATHVIIGHSERRHVMGESDELISRKVKAALDAGLAVILCVGELLQEREAGRTNDILRVQIETGLSDAEGATADNLIVAYEPVWAIGTGKTATSDQAQEAHVFIRGLLGATLDAERAAAVRIQYGGSVKPENAFELMSQADVDGALVGGASLKADSFAGIIREAGKVER